MDAEVVMPGTRARTVAAEHNPELLERHRRYAEEGVYPDSLLADRTIRGILRALNADSLLWRNHQNYLYYYARMGSFGGTGAKVRRESDLEGATFAGTVSAAELGELIERTSTTWVGFPDHHVGADMVAQW